MKKALLSFSLMLIITMVTPAQISLTHIESDNLEGVELQKFWRGVSNFYINHIVVNPLVQKAVNEIGVDVLEIHFSCKSNGQIEEKYQEITVDAVNMLDVKNDIARIVIRAHPQEFTDNIKEDKKQHLIYLLVFEIYNIKSTLDRKIEYPDPIAISKPAFVSAIMEAEQPFHNGELIAAYERGTTDDKIGWSKELFEHLKQFESRADWNNYEEDQKRYEEFYDNAHVVQKQEKKQIKKTFKDYKKTIKTIVNRNDDNENIVLALMELLPEIKASKEALEQRVHIRLFYRIDQKLKGLIDSISTHLFVKFNSEVEIIVDNTRDNNTKILALITLLPTISTANKAFKKHVPTHLFEPIDTKFNALTDSISAHVKHLQGKA